MQIRSSLITSPGRWGGGWFLVTSVEINHFGMFIILFFIQSVLFYRPVALTSTVMKCFKRLVKPRIRAILPATLDPYQFAYRRKRSTEDAKSTTLHTTLTHLKYKDTYARILYIDFSQAFNTIIPQRLAEKLLLLGLHPTTCLWVLDFLTERPHTISIGNKPSNSITLSSGDTRGIWASSLRMIPQWWDLFVEMRNQCTGLTI